VWRSAGDWPSPSPPGLPQRNAWRRSGDGWQSGQHSGGAETLIADALREATGKVATSEALATSARRWTREALYHGMPEKEAPDRQKKS
jgi:hypothetical protein